EDEERSEERRCVIFIGFGRKLMKLLHAEDGGMVMYIKRLEAWRFKLSEYAPESNSYPMEWRGRRHSGKPGTETPAKCKEYHV
ncbi:LOW QUALITY PROTEIN: hypothetical protein HMPREF0105_3772, partial [Bacteroides sp. 3_1_33FAA]